MKVVPAVKELDILDGLSFEPLSKANWSSFVALFGKNGACGNCWCMYFRLNYREFVEGKQDDGNKEKMKDLVWDNQPTGILTFYDGQPIGWCSFAPREQYQKLKK